MTSGTVACQAPLPKGILKTRILEWVAMVSSRDLPNLEIEPRSPALQAILYHLCHQGSLDSIPERTGSFQCGANEAFLKIFIYLTALGLSHSMDL